MQLHAVINFTSGHFGKVPEIQVTYSLTIEHLSGHKILKKNWQVFLVEKYLREGGEERSRGDSVEGFSCPICVDISS